jgi:hypothetical protein
MLDAECTVSQALQLVCVYVALQFIFNLYEYIQKPFYYFLQRFSFIGVIVTPLTRHWTEPSKELPQAARLKTGILSCRPERRPNHLATPHHSLSPLSTSTSRSPPLYPSLPLSPSPPSHMLLSMLHSTVPQYFQHFHK